MRKIRTLLRRPGWLSRPIAVIIGVVIGLGGLGGAAGAILGELGGAGSEMHLDEGRHHDIRFGRVGDDRDGVRVGGPGSGSPR
jgi:hypothetical protein